MQVKHVLSMLLLAATPALGEQPTVNAIAVEGTEFVVTLNDGRSLRSKDLVGAVLDVRFEGRPAKVRIAQIELDPGDKSGTVWLHTLEQRQADGSWANLCTPGPDKRQQGFPLMVDGSLELTCSSGALGKCVRFGYRPWADGPGGQSLAPQHAACVHMVRGDYGGDGQPWTRDGVLIDIFDPKGIQTADDGTDLAFEAGWTTQGAVCVHHVRVKENTTLAALEERYPQLRGRTGAICTADFARGLGAIVLNRSRD
ncbi:MAG: hypothetical protein JOY64_25610 [Alphaproteobacteria bacterium]|nr:hypothetical protein [Alphaproteobacteria bacterium]MBV8411030.1 hypothetical protein [Alphaproteobacteria bacterium]